MAFLTGYEPVLTYVATINVDNLLGVQPTGMLEYTLYECKGAFGSVYTPFGTLTVSRPRRGSSGSPLYTPYIIIDVGFQGTNSPVTWTLPTSPSNGQTVACGTDIKVSISVPCKEYIEETRRTNWPYPEEQSSGSYNWTLGYNTMPNKDNDFVSVKQYLVTSDVMNITISSTLASYTNSYSVANPNITLDSDDKFVIGLDLEAYSFSHTFTTTVPPSTVIVNPGSISASVALTSNILAMATGGGYSGTVDGVTISASATSVSVICEQGRYVDYTSTFWPVRPYTFTVDLFDVEGNHITETVDINVPKATDHTHSAVQTVIEGQHNQTIESNKYTMEGHYHTTCTWADNFTTLTWIIQPSGTPTTITSQNVDKLISAMGVSLVENSMYSVGLDVQLSGETAVDNYKDTRIQGKGKQFSTIDIAYARCYLDLFCPSRYTIVAGEAISDGEAYGDTGYVEDAGDAIVADGKWTDSTYTLGYITNGTKIPELGATKKLGYIESSDNSVKREFGLTKRVDWSTGRCLYIIADCYDATNTLITTDVTINVTTVVDTYDGNYDIDLGSGLANTKNFTAVLSNSKAEVDLANPTNAPDDEIEYDVDLTAGDSKQNYILHYPFPAFDTWRNGVSDVKELSLTFVGATKVRIYALYLGDDVETDVMAYHIHPSHEGWWNMDRWDDTGRFDGDAYFTRIYYRIFLLAYLRGKLVHSMDDIYRQYKKGRAEDVEGWYDRETFTKSVRTLSSLSDFIKRRTVNILEYKEDVGNLRTEGDIDVPTITANVLGTRQRNVCWASTKATTAANTFERQMLSEDSTCLGSFGVVFTGTGFAFNVPTIQYNFDSIWYWPMKLDDEVSTVPYNVQPLTFAKVLKGNVASTYLATKTATLSNTQTYDVDNYLYVGISNPYDATITIDDKSYVFSDSTVAWPDTYLEIYNGTDTARDSRPSHDRKGFHSRTTHVVNRPIKGTEVTNDMLANCITHNNQIIGRQDKTTGIITMFVFDRKIMKYSKYLLLDKIKASDGYTTGVTINPTGFAIDSDENEVTITLEVTKSEVEYIWVVNSKQASDHNEWKLQHVIQI